MMVGDPLAWALWTILVPFAFALLVFLFPRCASHGAMAAAVGIGACSIAAVLGVLRHGPGRMAVGGWAVPLGIEIHLDGLSALMLATTALVGTVSTIYAVGYLAHAPLDGGDSAAPGSGRDHRALFMAVWLVLWGSLNALFLSSDLFNVYVTLELIGISSVVLISMAGAAQALTAAVRYLLVGLVGSLCYLAGIGLLYAAYGTLDFGLLSRASLAGHLPPMALALMTSGLLLKTALFPFHFWLPTAHGNAPAPVSAILSALVVKAPYYLLLRLWIDVLGGQITPESARLLGFLGTAAILWGAVQALLADRVKRLVAYSTVSQLGYLFLVFPLALEKSGGYFAWNGVAYFMLSHACAKASMFLAAGTLLLAAESDRIDHLDGISQCIPLPMFAFSIAAASLIGLPPSGGFMAKWLLLKSALIGGQWVTVVVILLGGLLTVAYFFRVFSRSFMSKPMIAACLSLPKGMHWSPLVLSLIALCLGLFASQILSLLQVGSPWTEGAPAWRRG